MSDPFPPPSAPSPQARAARGGVPYSVHAVVTHKCNLACQHCYQAEHDSDDLPTDEWIALFDQLQQLGVLFLTLGGGEPMARRDFWTLVEAARARRFAVSLYTNGTLIDEAAAKRLRQLGVANVEISIHGAQAHTHDVFVRRKGAFDRVNRAIDFLEAAGVPLTLKTSVTPGNHMERPALQQRFGQRPLVRLQIGTHVFARDDGDRSSQVFRTSEAQERAVRRDEFARMDAAALGKVLDGARKRLGMDAAQLAPCQAARTIFAIQPNGDVTPCTVSYEMVMGNARQRPLSAIWQDSAVAGRLRRVTQQTFADESEECARCPYRTLCHKCMALSHSESGSPSGWSSQVCQSTKVYWSEVRRRADELGLACPV